MIEASILVSRVREHFPEVGATVQFGDLALLVRPHQLRELARFLRDDSELQFIFLENLCGVDYLDQEPRFEVVVHLLSMRHQQRIAVRTGVPEDAPVVPSLVDLFPTANFQEREAYDMFGIRFEGHPDLRRILMPDDWVGHPQRKDHPLGYEDIEFSFNQETLHARKPFAKE